MQIFDFEIVDSLPALYHPELDLLVISDLHLGLEAAVSYDGNYLPQFQLEEIKEDVQKLKDETGAERILVNGDLKHEFKYNRFSEEKEIREFFELLESLFNEVILVKGNHDTFIDDFVGSAIVKDNLIEGNILFSHGHQAFKESDEYDTLVIGHEHPALELEDEIGVTEKVDCFLYGEMENGKKIIVMPAFSKMAGGSAVNRMPSKDLLSPVLKNEVSVGNLEAVAVDKEAGLFKFPKLDKI